MAEDADTGSPRTSGRRTAASTIRRIGALVLAVAALGVLFGMAPRGTVTRSNVAVVMAKDALNQESADSAPKQTVVNGWTARDLLELIAQEGLDSHDQRPAALLTIAVLGLCLALGTTGAANHGASRETAEELRAEASTTEQNPETGV